MKKRNFLTVLLPLMLVLALLPAVSAFEIEKNKVTDVITSEDTGIPAHYSLTISNPEHFDEIFSLYSILTIDILPKESFNIGASDERTISVLMYPSQKVKERCGFGECMIQYYIKGSSSGTVTDIFEIKVIPLSKIINATLPEVVVYDSKILPITIENKENIDFENISLDVESDFVRSTEELSLAPKTKKTIGVELDSAKLKAVKAGTHTLKLNFNINNCSYVVDKQIEVSEYEYVTTTETLKRSFFGYTKTITKKNEGNAPQLVTLEVDQNRIEGAFTGYSIDAAEKQALGNTVTSEWQRQLEPGESLTVEMKTNYAAPVLLLGALIIGSTAFYMQRRPRVVVRKKAYKVRTKDGTLALKILLLVKNVGNEVGDVRCTDYVPKMTELHDRFGDAQPDAIDKNKLQWNFGSMMPDESKAVSYIVYSKVAPLGMNFPKAVVSYTDYRGKGHYTFSNNIEAFEA